MLSCVHCLDAGALTIVDSGILLEGALGQVILILQSVHGEAEPMVLCASMMVHRVLADTQV